MRSTDTPTAAEWRAMVHAVVEEFGGFTMASLTGDGDARAVATQAGLLHVSTPSADCTTCMAAGGVFMRFEHPDLMGRVAGVFDANPCSGKWNICIDDWREALAMLRQRLQRVTAFRVTNQEA